MLSPLPPPSKNFSSQPIPVFPLEETVYRLNPTQFSTSIFFDKTGKGRFDGPKQGYGIMYVGADPFGTWAECYARGLGDTNFRGVSKKDLQERNLYLITSHRPLILADLTGESLTKIGIDARISSGSYQMSRRWAKAIYLHPQQVDGIRYRSRHDDSRYLYGLFDRCEPHLTEKSLGNLHDCNLHLLASILDFYQYGLL
jgi:RES domain